MIILLLNLPCPTDFSRLLLNLHVLVQHVPRGHLSSSDQGVGGMRIRLTRTSGTMNSLRWQCAIMPSIQSVSVIPSQVQISGLSDFPRCPVRKLVNGALYWAFEVLL